MALSRMVVAPRADTAQVALQVRPERKRRLLEFVPVRCIQDGVRAVDVDMEST